MLFLYLEDMSLKVPRERKIALPSEGEGWFFGYRQVLGWDLMFTLFDRRQAPNCEIRLANLTYNSICKNNPQVLFSSNLQLGSATRTQQRTCSNFLAQAQAQGQLSGIAGAQGSSSLSPESCLSKGEALAQNGPTPPEIKAGFQYVYTTHDQVFTASNLQQLKRRSVGGVKNSDTHILKSEKNRKLVFFNQRCPELVIAKSLFS